MKKTTKTTDSNKEVKQPLLDSLLFDLSNICEKNAHSLSGIEVKLRSIHKSNTSLSGQNVSGDAKEKEPQTKMREIGNKIIILQAQSAWLQELHNHLSEIV